MTTLELIERGVGFNCLSDAYDIGKLDGARKFAEWLQEKSIDNTIALNYGKFKNRNIDELLAEWQKGEENDRHNA